MKQLYAHRLRLLHWCTDQTVTAALAEMELTAAQGRILSYLAHRKEPPCSRDLETEFHLTHPTVSGLLSRLEKKGFLEFRPDPQDRRCKRIYLLERGRQCHDRIHQAIQHNEEALVSGFTAEEKALFSRLLDRAVTNMGGSPCCHRNQKEEPETHD